MQEQETNQPTPVTPTLQVPNLTVNPLTTETPVSPMPKETGDIGKPVVTQYDRDQQTNADQDSVEELRKEVEALRQAVPVVNGDQDRKPPMLSDKVYDILRELALTWVPVLGIAYSAIAALWKLPYGYEVMITAAIVDIALSIILHISASSFNKSMAMFDGVLGLHGSASDPIATAKVFNGVDIAGKDSLNLKVVDNTH